MSDISPKSLTSLRRWAKIFLIVGIITSASGITHNIYVHFNPAGARIYGRLVHVRIGGRDFAVPSEYIRGPIPHGETKQLYVWATLPDYAPYVEILESKHQEPIGYRHLSILIDDTQSTTDLIYRYRRRREADFLLPEERPDIYGLHRTAIFRKRPVDPEAYPWSDLYFSTKGQDIEQFIACGVTEAPPRNSMCEHFFQDGRLLYQVGYSKRNLSNWNEIHQRLQLLIDSFTCVPVSEKTHSAKSIGGEHQCPP